MHPQRLPYNFILKVWVRWACLSVTVAPLLLSLVRAAVLKIDALNSFSRQSLLIRGNNPWRDCRQGLLTKGRNPCRECKAGAITK